MQINEKVKGYFVTNKNSNELYFTSDGLAFYNEGSATSQANNLVKAKKATAATVTKVTRAEVDAWVKAQAAVATPPADAPVLSPQQQAEALVKTTGEALAAAQVVLDGAKKGLDDATAAKSGLAADALPADKTAATKAVTAANKAVAEAQATYDNASLDATNAAEALAGLTPKA